MALNHTLEQLNALDRDPFTAALGGVFEHSPWIVNETWERRPFRDVANLHRELCETMRLAPRERKLALIRAHPDLAGRLAHEKKLTRDSAQEQASAGLSKLRAEELASFERLNAAYRERFGFPFIICVRLNDRHAILAAMQVRLNHAPEVEIETALGEIEKIAGLRLRDRLRDRAL